MDINTAVDIFYTVLFKGFSQFIPILKNKKNIHPPWFDKNVANLKNRRSKAFKKYKLSRNSYDYTVYSRLRSLSLSSALEE